MNGSRKNSVRGGRLSFSEKVQRGRPRDSNLNRPQSQGKPSNEDRQETRSRFSRDSSIIREQSQGKYSNEETQHSRSRLSSHSSVSSSFSANALPIVMSTPKRNTRQSNIALDSPTINKSSSNLSMNDSFTKKKFHKNYDPDIELRQVNERLSKRNSKSWADQSLLNDEQDEDLQKYSDKVKRGNKNLKLIQDTEVLARRQADIDKGKVKQCYRNYVYKVNKTEREPHMPRTPNKFIEMSRRAWDGMVRKWKKHIHAWNEPAFDALYASGIDFDCCSAASSIKTSVDSIDDNVERQIQLFAEEEDDTLQGPITRKRAISSNVYDKENIDDDTMENIPKFAECKLSDLHSGLTNDAAALSVGPIKRQKMSQAKE